MKLLDKLEPWWWSKDRSLPMHPADVGRMSLRQADRLIRTDLGA